MLERRLEKCVQILFDVKIFTHTWDGCRATKVDACRSVIYTNTSKTTNEIKEHRYTHTRVCACISYLSCREQMSDVHKPWLMFRFCHPNECDSVDIVLHAGSRSEKQHIVSSDSIKLLRRRTTSTDDLPCLWCASAIKYFFFTHVSRWLLRIVRRVCRQLFEWTRWS